MEWFRQLGRALRNLARIAREQPIWAITALVTSPVALIRHLFGVVVLFLITGLVLGLGVPLIRSEEHTSELQSLMPSSYAGFCLKEKNTDCPLTRFGTHQLSVLAVHRYLSTEQQPSS